MPQNDKLGSGKTFRVGSGKTFRAGKGNKPIVVTKQPDVVNTTNTTPPSNTSDFTSGKAQSNSTNKAKVSVSKSFYNYLNKNAEKRIENALKDHTDRWDITKALGFYDKSKGFKKLLTDAKQSHIKTGRSKNIFKIPVVDTLATGKNKTKKPLYIESNVANVYLKKRIVEENIGDEQTWSGDEAKKFYQASLQIASFGVLHKNVTEVDWTDNTKFRNKNFDVSQKSIGGAKADTLANHITQNTKFTGNDPFALTASEIKAIKSIADKANETIDKAKLIADFALKIVQIARDVQTAAADAGVDINNIRAEAAKVAKTHAEAMFGQGVNANTFVIDLIGNAAANTGIYDAGVTDLARVTAAILTSTKTLVTNRVQNKANQMFGRGTNANNFVVGLVGTAAVAATRVVATGIHDAAVTDLAGITTYINDDRKVTAAKTIIEAEVREEAAKHFPLAAAGVYAPTDKAEIVKTAVIGNAGDTTGIYAAGVDSLNKAKNVINTRLQDVIFNDNIEFKKINDGVFAQTFANGVVNLEQFPLFVNFDHAFDGIRSKTSDEVGVPVTKADATASADLFYNPAALPDDTIVKKVLEQATKIYRKTDGVAGAFDFTYNYIESGIKTKLETLHAEIAKCKFKPSESEYAILQQKVTTLCNELYTSLFNKHIKPKIEGAVLMPKPALLNPLNPETLLNDIRVGINTATAYIVVAPAVRATTAADATTATAAATNTNTSVADIGARIILAIDNYAGLLASPMAKYKIKQDLTLPEDLFLFHDIVGKTQGGAGRVGGLIPVPVGNKVSAEYIQKLKDANIAIPPGLKEGVTITLGIMNAISVNAVTEAKRRAFNYIANKFADLGLFRSQLLTEPNVSTFSCKIDEKGKFIVEELTLKNGHSSRRTILTLTPPFSPVLLDKIGEMSKKVGGVYVVSNGEAKFGGPSVQVFYSITEEQLKTINEADRSKAIKLDGKYLFNEAIFKKNGITPPSNKSEQYRCIMNHHKGPLKDAETSVTFYNEYLQTFAIASVKPSSVIGANDDEFKKVSAATKSTNEPLDKFKEDVQGVIKEFTNKYKGDKNANIGAHSIKALGEIAKSSSIKQSDKDAVISSALGAIFAHVVTVNGKKTEDDQVKAKAAAVGAGYANAATSDAYEAALNGVAGGAVNARIVYNEVLKKCLNDRVKKAAEALVPQLRHLFLNNSSSVKMFFDKEIGKIVLNDDNEVICDPSLPRDLKEGFKLPLGMTITEISNFSKGIESTNLGKESFDDKFAEICATSINAFDGSNAFSPYYVIDEYRKFYKTDENIKNALNDKLNDIFRVNENGFYTRVVSFFNQKDESGNNIALGNNCKVFSNNYQGPVAEGTDTFYDTTIFKNRNIFYDYLITNLEKGLEGDNPPLAAEGLIKLIPVFFPKVKDNVGVGANERILPVEGKQKERLADVLVKIGLNGFCKFAEELKKYSGNTPVKTSTGVDLPVNTIANIVRTKAIENYIKAKTGKAGFVARVAGQADDVYETGIIAADAAAYNLAFKEAGVEFGIPCGNGVGNAAYRTTVVCVPPYTNNIQAAPIDYLLFENNKPCTEGVKSFFEDGIVEQVVVDTFAEKDGVSNFVGHLNNMRRVTKFDPTVVLGVVVGNSALLSNMLGAAASKAIEEVLYKDEVKVTEHDGEKPYGLFEGDNIKGKFNPENLKKTIKHNNGYFDKNLSPVEKGAGSIQAAATLVSLAKINTRVTGAGNELDMFVNRSTNAFDQALDPDNAARKEHVKKSPNAKSMANFLGKATHGNTYTKQNIVDLAGNFCEDGKTPQESESRLFEGVGVDANDAGTVAKKEAVYRKLNTKGPGK